MKPDIIKIVGRENILINKNLLNIDVAQLWIGERSEGPTDNDDKRVLKERVASQAEKEKPGWKIAGIEAVEIRESVEHPGWFEIDTSLWIPGIYRFMFHSKAGVEAPNGSPLNPDVRDMQYSWPKIDEDLVKNLSDEQKKFLYKEPNGTGFCFRIEIIEGREIKPAGNLLNL